MTDVGGRVSGGSVHRTPLLPVRQGLPGTPARGGECHMERGKHVGSVLGMPLEQGSQKMPAEPLGRVPRLAGV